MKIVHEQFRALTQGLGRRHKLVADHEKLVGDAEERVRVSLHGSSLSEQGQQAAPAVQGNAACVRDIALIKSPLGRRQKIDDSPAVFRCGTDEQLHDAFLMVSLVLSMGGKTPAPAGRPETDAGEEIRQEGGAAADYAPERIL